jgi:chromate transporter
MEATSEVTANEPTIKIAAHPSASIKELHNADLITVNPLPTPQSSQVVPPQDSGLDNSSMLSASPAIPTYGIPEIGYLSLFWMFLGIGFRAWGGPVAQIALLKEIIVVDKKWVSPQHFQRSFAIYQVLPGPEAHELCCWAGYLAKGRIGSVLAGLGFMLPGFVLMLVAAILYDKLGITNAIVQAIFGALQPAVAAMVCRAVHKIGDHALRNAETHAFDWRLSACCVIAAIQSVMGVNFFLTLIHCSTLFAFGLLPNRRVVSILWCALVFAAFFVVIAMGGSFGALVPKAIGAGQLSNMPAATFLVGLEGGLLTFGGAYTAIPVVQYEAVVAGRWLTTQQFLDGIAIGQVLPSPLVIFTTFVGFLSDEWVGAVLMTLGMFLPAFSFTLIGHNCMERVVGSKGVVTHLLDGVSAAVVGLILITAVQLTWTVVRRPIDAVIFVVAGLMLVQIKHKLTPVAVVVFAAVAGAAFYTNDQQ